MKLIKFSILTFLPNVKNSPSLAIFLFVSSLFKSNIEEILLKCTISAEIMGVYISIILRVLIK